MQLIHDVNVEEFKNSLDGNGTRVLNVRSFCWNTIKPLNYHHNDISVVYSILSSARVSFSLHDGLSTLLVIDVD